MLESYIQSRLAQKELLLMTHIVLGYPDFDACAKVVESMVEKGVDLMELQIPFSEPMADGPVILRANADAIASGATVDKSLEMAEKLTARFDIPFLFMTYYNIVFRQGVEKFVQEMKRIGMVGAIIPDLPPEEGKEYLAAMQKAGLAPIHIFTPNTSDERMQQLGACSDGFIYAVARKGVTGKETEFSAELDGYLARCKVNTSLPIALGFGVASKSDIDFLRGKVDIAVVGSQTIRVVDENGPEAAGPFIESLLDK